MPLRQRNIVIYSVIILTLSVFMLMALDNAVAQVSSNRLESVVNETRGLEDSPQVIVGKNPSFIGISSDLNDVYVVNSYSDSVSVIDRATSALKKDIDVRQNPQYLINKGNYLYVSNAGNGTVSVIDSSTNNVTTTIPVGERPMELLDYGNNIYVANMYSDFLSVIDVSTNKPNGSITVGDGFKSMVGIFGPQGYIFVAHDGGVSKINPKTNIVTADIPVDVAFPNVITEEYSSEDSKDYIYVTSSGNTITKIDATTNEVSKIPIPVRDSLVGMVIWHDDIYGLFPGIEEEIENGYVSVIDQARGTIKKNITVGNGPNSIVNYEGEYLYITNYGSDTVSVIDPNTNTVNSTLLVGKSPSYVYTGSDEIDSAYVANEGSGAISVIDKTSNEVVAGVTFDISPSTTGYLTCATDRGEIEPPSNRFMYLSSGTKCTAIPSKGFGFVSWIEVLDRNSTKTINATASSGSPWTVLLDTFGMKPEDPTATLTVNKFGNFTANFSALPPPVPPEYWTSLFGVIATALVGSLLIPATIGWFKSKKQTSRLKSFHEQMVCVYEDNKLNEKDIPRLNSLYKNISDSYAAGKINNDQYTNLKNEVSTAFQEIFKNSIESIPEQDLETLKKIRKDIIDAYNYGKLSNDQYVNLKDKISIGYERIFKRKIVNGGDDLQQIQEDISDAYSKGNITKLHYDLLNEKILKMTQKKD